MFITPGRAKQAVNDQTMPVGVMYFQAGRLIRYRKLSSESQIILAYGTSLVNPEAARPDF